jgi:predicted CoA-binding protein
LSTIEKLLRESKTIAVVGLSSNPLRPSHGVADYMQRAGYRIIPVNPRETEVLGEKAYARLTDIPEPVDLVNIFRRPNLVGSVVEEAIAKGAKGIWMQLGIVNEEAAECAQQAGLDIVMDRCIMVEHRRLVRP